MVIPKLEQGVVYSFVVEAEDSSNNMVISNTHTMLMPKLSEGVIELIMRTMNDSFGWLGNIKQ